ncbi:MAG: methyltransferase domain-containing protein [Planctomycetota bacterium]
MTEPYVSSIGLSIAWTHAGKRSRQQEIDNMRTLETCPVCNHAERSLVCKYNNLILHDQHRGSDLARADYAMCHQCGLVHATRRPSSDEFRSLLVRFKDVLGKEGGEDSYDGKWTAEDVASLSDRLKAGWLVTDESGLKRKRPRWFAPLRHDRVSGSFHFDILSSLFDLTGKRVVEFRTKTGFLLDRCRRQFGCDVYGIPLTKMHKQIAEEFYKIPCNQCLNFEEIEIPFEGKFDVIIAKHMFTHALYPERLFATLRERLRPGGAVYFYDENDDAFLFGKIKNLFGEQKCFHFQNFDVNTYARCLRYAGFDPQMIFRPESGASAMCCFARLDSTVKPNPISAKVFARRLEMYRSWHDQSMLSLPTPVLKDLPDDLAECRERAVRNGEATNTLGVVRANKHFRICHGAGFEKKNGRGEASRRPTGGARRPMYRRVADLLPGPAADLLRRFKRTG